METMTKQQSLLSVWVGNLGKYNEGELVGEWLSLPYTEDEFKALLERIGINEQYEEYAVFDVDNNTDIDSIDIGIGMNTSLANCNDIAEALDSLSTYETKKLAAVIEAGIYSDGSIEDIKYMIDNLDDYAWHDDINSEYDLGYFYANEIIDIGRFDTVVEECFDYERYGKDLADELNGYFTSYGWVEKLD